MTANARWYDRASCRGLEELFFPSIRRKGSEAAAQRVCAGCSVRAECLDDAMQVEGTAESRYAVRGGLTSTERTGLQRSRDQERHATTGSTRKVPA
jgi:WhiB family redox-sensing transcriptional regulator